MISRGDIIRPCCIVTSVNDHDKVSVMKKDMTKKQHYIPQFYLRRFTDEKGFLHIYDFNKQRYFKTAPKDFGYENYLYETPLSKPDIIGEKFLLENHIEDIFAKYEGEFDTFLKKLDKICTPYQRKGVLILHDDEKNVLRRFIANMFFRNPITMERMNLNKVPDNFFEEDEKVQLNEGFGFNADELVVAAQKKAMLTEEFEKNNIKSFVERIQNLDFTFLYSKHIPFITSSFPVIMGKDESFIHFPLSQYLSVHFENYPKSKEKNNRLAYVDDDVVDFCNRQQLKFIKKLKWCLIAPSKEIIDKYWET